MKMKHIQILIQNIERKTVDYLVKKINNIHNEWEVYTIKAINKVLY